MENNIQEFLNALASKAPTPGGGGAAGMAGSLAAALGSMVTNLTVGKKKYAEFTDELNIILAKTEGLRVEILGFIDRDAEAFAPLAAAYGIPKDAPGRAETLEKALDAASAVPAVLLEKLGELPAILERLTVIGSKLAVSDVGCAAELCRAAAGCAALNVYINTKLMTDKERAASMNTRTDALLADIETRCEAVAGLVRKKVKGEAK